MKTNFRQFPRIALPFIFLFVSVLTYAQNDALFSVDSNSKGILIPTMTETQKNAIASPSEGLLIYQTTAPKGFYYNNGTDWIMISDAAALNQISDADDDTKVQVEEFADEDVIRFDIGGTEYWRMAGPRLENVNNGNSLFLGLGAGTNDDMNFNLNTFLGNYSGFENTTGEKNTASGFRALQNNIGSNLNTASGYYALHSTTGQQNTAFGANALLNNVGGSNNTAIGFNADVQSGGLTNATAIGYNAKVGSSNSLVLGSSGTRVGIGTSNPNEKLHVVGNIRMVDGNQGSGKVLTSNANGVGSWQSLPNDPDEDASNEIQDLSSVLGEGNNAGGNKITNLMDPAADQDAATKKYVDDLDAAESDARLAGDDNLQMQIDADMDGDATNEYNTSVSLSGTTLSVTDGGGTLSTDLSSLQDGTGTDDQTLDDVLSEGNSAEGEKITNLADPTMDQDAATKKYVDDNDAVNDADADSTNELNTSVSLSGTTLTVTDSGGGKTADLSSLQDGTGTDDQTLDDVLSEGNSAEGERITNLADPTMDQDAATKKYVDDNDAVNDADADSTNELNTSVSLSGTTLTVTDSGGGKTADLSSLQDGTGTDNQTLDDVLSEGNSAEGEKITNLADPTMDQDAATKKYVDDNDAVNDADADATNELNTSVSLSGTTLTVTDSGGGKTADLASLQDGTGTDNQTLDDVLSEGNSAEGEKITNLADPTMDQDAATKKYVDDNDAVNDADADATNELNSSVSLSGTTLTVTDSGGGKTADLSSLQDGTGTDNQTLDDVLSEGNSAEGEKITNLADPTMDQDAATKKYVDDNAGGLWSDNSGDISYSGGNVGVGLNAPTESIHTTGNIAVGYDDTTTPVAGTIRWNDQTKVFEGFDGTVWKNITTGTTASSFEDAKITASDAANFDQFGISVAISGDYAIVGSYFDDDAGSDSGSAYIFVRSGSSWSEQAKITASDAAASDRFGFSVAISGDYAIVGSYFDDDAGSESGSAYIFMRSGSSWSEQAKITASDAAANDIFGYSVAISGDYAIVGSYFDDDAGSESGSAYIFVRSGSSWSEQAKITASDAAGGDQFGISVAISGDYAIVGSYADDDAGSNSGSAYIFMRSGSSWSEQAKITASDAASGYLFGISVAISGDYAIVGSYLDDDAGSGSGSAYIFVRSGSSWSEQAKITASDAAGGDQFGRSVAISGDYAIVGSYLDDDAGGESGSAYIFVRSGSSWSEQAKITASDAAAFDRFGFSVAISGDYAIVGSYLDDDAGNESGSAYIYETP